MTTAGRLADTRKERGRLEPLSLFAPGMWADHHVLAAHEALAKLAGVEKVEASALRHTIRVWYDPKRTDPDLLTAALGDLGCLRPLAPDEVAGDDRREICVTGCSTVTNPADIAMSGDFRRY
jgi:copper chaperone CopZ